ncbi:MAG: winged helix-turn-helix transcriptional regulator [Anaerolineae bacterium]|nr:winged helix-turn-helix transcriptional regulator [Anaerolineae bacterium]
MATTRDRILQTLLDKPKSTIKDLADAVSINAISVRHHLASLQADGLVNAEEERHGVGRPRLVYSLTTKGTEIFPSNYLQLTDRLLNQLKDSLPASQLRVLFESMAERQAASVLPDFDTMRDPEERIAYLAQILGGDGHTIRWEKQEDGTYLLEVANCPYIQISKQHPEICMYDQELFRKLLGMKITKTGSICHGDRACTYIVRP